MSDERLKAASDNNVWLTAEELAPLLNTSVESVWRLSRSGQIPCYRLGRLMRFSLDEVRSALKSPDLLQATKNIAAVGEERDQ